MPATRRDFLRQSSLALVAAAFAREHFSWMVPGSGELMGLQLYSVREDMQKDPLGTLKALANIGYRYVEHANYVDRKVYGYSPADFKKILDDLGMKMPSGHTVFRRQHWDESKKDFTPLWRNTVSDAAVMGQQLVISPWLDDEYRKTYDGLVKYMEIFNKVGESCKAEGMMFGYHNHDFEFSQTLNGKQVYDIILQNTDPTLVTQQLDAGNLYNGGAIAMEVIKRYPGRFLSMHVKDEIEAKEGNEKYESAILGSGIVSIRDVASFGRQNGTRHFIIEQESYQGKTPLECMKENYSIMKSWGYA